MTGLDTNILIRYIAQDDAAQSARATALIENECSAEEPGFIGLVVLAEIAWVSEACYGASRAQIAGIMRNLLTSRQLQVQDAEIAWKALRIFEASQADFADCLIERSASGLACERTVTFDKKAAKAGMVLLG